MCFLYQVVKQECRYTKPLVAGIFDELIDTFAEVQPGGIGLRAQYSLQGTKFRILTMSEVSNRNV